MVTDEQVRRLFKMENKHQHLYQAADAAGMSTKTARKYLTSGVLPSQCRPLHDWAIHLAAISTQKCFLDSRVFETLCGIVKTAALSRNLFILYLIWPSCWPLKA